VICGFVRARLYLHGHTEIFYIIYKRNVPSIQCKKRLRFSNSMSEIDFLSLVFIDFYVPALTPRLYCIKTALQLTENIALLALCRIQTGSRGLDIHQVFEGYHL
jgi:hypothetical protein